MLFGFFVGIFAVFVVFAVFFILISRNENVTTNNIISEKNENQNNTKSIALDNPPVSKVLPNSYHIFQSFNNCGPASLSMALSYYKINVSQADLGRLIRPYQVPSGDNDDKSVTLEELAEKSKEYQLIPYHRASGNIEYIKYFIANDMPIITRTWTKENEDIGHYRVVKGYDDNTNELIQDDSLQGKNLRYSYNDFNILWEKFNYEYLVLVPKDKNEIAKKILNDDIDPKNAWKKAKVNLQRKLLQNPNDSLTRFNLSVAYYNLGEYTLSVEEFEKAENNIPFRTLWYQIEPIEAYFKLGNYDKVFLITDRILNNQNRAFSELYLIRGEAYLKLGSIEKAKEEFDKAVFYNSNFESKIPAI